MNNPFETALLQEIPTPSTFDERCYLAANPDVAEAIGAGRIASGWAHFKKFGVVEGRRQFAKQDEAATCENFDETRYLESNPDVAQAIEQGKFPSARAHFERFGVCEKRRQRRVSPVPAIRARKLTALRPLLLDPEKTLNESGKYCFLDEATRARDSLDDEIPISENSYDQETVELIESCREGLVLDVGAGFRPVYYSNVVNLEIADYPTTDVIGAADSLPFKDASFDGVISIAVLEHVKDPFRCAREIARVLKPGGWLKCCVPFLQPLHGFPHHYFNMTHEGLRTLFEPYLTIERQEVNPATHPVWAIAWQLRSWAEGLPPKARKSFLRQRVSDLIAFPGPMLEQAWAKELPVEKQFELAAATILLARKPQAPTPTPSTQEPQ
ncbi:class I SAM-dependent methyltransferase [Methylocystis sp. MJC1]|jgi:SAM-dependent methyltransferase|uniref:class I SAM-dependent methyltransferase n=1 Tax=Methylocystis sp. MJC1 TaxID=2654282 RepID=UPI0013EC7C52|nr:class I SAM-dependent methyltransferase [Methylocystis sp. MJC1]MBU6525870.1 class I SAM-dependent methyltransferase [Methylocystis sp. MJC1]UZX12337.1 class I SAM-dependent methyltransferase [Methylocystis sp. MJC1]